MQSGAVLGAAAMMDGMCDRFAEELCKVGSIVATGGLAREIVPLCRHDVIYDEHLLLDGLRIIYEKNR